jgi:dihydrofolate reductase
MGKLVESTFVTLDGSIGQPQVWGPPYWDDEHTAYASIIEGDVAEGVAALKDRPGGDLLKFGTGELDRALIEHGLVDEFHFWVFPVLAGGGQRLIEGIDTTHLKLVDSATFSSGIVVHVLEPR